MREQLNSALDVLQGAARYRWPAILAAWVLCLVGWAFVMLLPNKYEARSRVFVDTSTALSPMIQGLAIQQDVTAQLNLMQQALVGNAQLDRVIDETDLVAAAFTDEDRAAIKDRLRASIDVSMDIASSRGPKGLVYWLSYRDTDRDRSLQVVQMLLDSLVKGTLGGSMEDAETAQEFLVARIQEYEQRLGEAEDRLAEFKKRNIGTMPGEEGDYFTRLQNEIDGARKTRDLLAVAVSRRDELAGSSKTAASWPRRRAQGPRPASRCPAGRRRPAATP